MHENIDFYWNEYSSLKDWIIFSDAKAGAIIAFYSIIATLLLPNAIEAYNKIHEFIDLQSKFWWIILWGILGIILIAVALSTIYALWSYIPDSPVPQPNSLIYYKQIQKKYPTVKSFIQAVHVEYKVSGKMEIDLLGQIWALAHVAQRKYILVHRSYCLLMVAIIFGIIFGFISLFIKIHTSGIRIPLLG
jgi:hypothetical protein